MEWDDVIGKHVLFGLTYLDENGNVAGQEQKHGVSSGTESGERRGASVAPLLVWIDARLSAYGLAT